MPFITAMATVTIADAARPRLAKGVRLQSVSVTGKRVLLFPEGIVELNETEHEILSRCDGQMLNEIVHALAEVYDTDLTPLAAAVRETVTDLHPRDLTDLILAARETNLYTNLITSGIGLDDDRVCTLHDAGLDSIQLSFQSDSSDLADEIAGARAHQRKLDVAAKIRAAGIRLSLN